MEDGASSPLLNFSTLMTRGSFLVSKAINPDAKNSDS